MPQPSIFFWGFLMGGVRNKKTVRTALAAAADPAAYETAPAPPARLRGEGRAYWERIAPLLVARRVLTPCHLEALETLCDQWAIYLAVKEYLAKDVSRWTVTAESGYETEAPQVRAMGNAHRNLLRLWAAFGLTPHSEPRLLPERGPGAKAREPSRLVAIAAEKTAHDQEHRPP